MHRLATSQDWVTPSHQASSSRCCEMLISDCSACRTPRGFQAPAQISDSSPTKRLLESQDLIIQQAPSASRRNELRHGAFRRENRALQSCLSMAGPDSLTYRICCTYILQDILIYLLCFKSHHKESRYAFDENNLCLADVLSGIKLYKSFDWLQCRS